MNLFSSRILSSCLTLLLVLGLYSQNSERPNVIFIMVDDMAWADVTQVAAQNGFYELPNMLQMAKDGMTLNRFYPGGPNCAPSRACLVSGMYTPRTKIYQPSGWAKGPENAMRFAAPMKSNGKNNFGMDIRTQLDPKTISIAEMLENAGYATARIGKWHLGPDKQGFGLSTQDGVDTSEKRYYNDTTATDRMVRGAFDFMEKHQKQSFFLYFPLWEVHTPIVAKPHLVAKYKAKWQQWPDKSIRWNPTYAAMLEEADTAIGALRQKINQLGLADNTLVILTSDNGGAGHITSNAPLRGAKGSLYEGGIRTFAAAVWPSVIRPGSQSDDPITGVDLMPSLAELAGAELPNTQPIDGQSFVPTLKGKKRKERAIFWHYPLYLEGKDTSKQGWPSDRVLPIYGSKELLWRAVPASAIMKGDWKLIYYHEYGSYELFHIGKDPNETQELSKSKPKMAKKLNQELQHWLKTTDADIPSVTNPHFKSR